MAISGEILDGLLNGVERPEDLPAVAGLMKEPKVELMERMRSQWRIWAAR